MHRNKFQERYQKIGETDDRFDINFWQAQGERAIFEAAEGMIRDYLSSSQHLADFRFNLLIQEIP